MNPESLVEKYLGITNYHTEKIPLAPDNSNKKVDYSVVRERFRRIVYYLQSYPIFSRIRIAS